MPDADAVAAEGVADAHDTLKRWLAGDHTSNNVHRVSDDASDDPWREGHPVGR